MTEIIERVARALCLSNREQHPEWARLSEIERADEIENAWDLWKSEARAAIAAMPGEPVAWQRRYRSDCRGWELISKDFYDKLVAEKLEFPESEVELRPLYATPAMPATDAREQALHDVCEFLRDIVGGAELSENSRRHAADFLAALSHPSQGGWQPISTAPKDGTRILVVCDGDTRVAAWGKTSHVPMYGFCLADQGEEEFDLVSVDLWQPLPAPPEVQP